MITFTICVTAFENENKKRTRDAVRKILQKYIKRRQQKKGIKSLTTYFPGAFSESKEPNIPINKEKRFPLRFKHTVKIYIRGTNSSFASAVKKTILGLSNKLSKSKI